MESHKTGAEFHTTHWTLVSAARGDRAGLEQLLRTYYAPVYTFIRRQGYSGHDASDLTQEFLAQIVLGRDLIGKADPQRGRFRSFLKQSLRNFLIDQHRSGRHSKRGTIRPGGPGAAEGSDGSERAIDPAALDGPGSVFDRAWAATIIELALERLEEACRLDGMEGHWAAFDANVLGPTLRKLNPVPLEDLAKTVGAADATQVSNMIQTVKRRFRRSLREVVAETVEGGPDQVEEELAELRAFF